MKKTLFIFLFSITNILAEAADTVKWVAPWGNDSGLGESFSPYKTLKKALTELDSGTIMFRATDKISVYREQVVIDGKENITIKGYGAGNLGNRYIIFDGTTDLSEYNWTHLGNNIYKTNIDTTIWQLFIEGKEMVMARWPNAQFNDKSIYSWDSWAQGDESLSSNGTVVVDSKYHDMSKISNSLDTAHAILNLGSFRTWNSKIDHAQGNNTFTFDRYISDNQYKDKHHYFFVEGDFDLLDTVNEWYHNPKNGDLWVMTDGTNPNDLEKSSNSIVNIPTSLKEAIDLSKQNNPDIKIAKFDLEQSEKDLSIAKSDLAPTASLSLERSYAEDVSSTIDEREKDILKATVSWPFYSGGKKFSTINKNTNLSTRKRLLLDDAIRTNETNVSSMWSSLESSKSFLASVKAQVRAAKIANDGIVAEYERGSRTTLDVIQSNALLLAAQISLASSEKNYLMAQYNLLKAVGLLNSQYLNLK